MAGSTLRNALARRNHKERAQPLHRQRLGLLEKHKDYVHRARDYKSKQDRIRKLREKAAFRNKDEFYFGMVKQQTKGGVAVGDRGNEALGVDVVKVLKSQDAGWVRVQIAKDEKKVAKLRAELELSAPAASTSASSAEWSAAAELAEVEKMAAMGIVLRPRDRDSGSQAQARKADARAERDNPRGHVVFVDDRAEFEQFGSSSRSKLTTASLDAEEQDVEDEDQEQDLGWEEASPSTSRASSKSHKSASIPKIKASPTELSPEEEAASIRQNRLDLLSTLSAHLARLAQLRIAETRLAQTAALQGKGAARRVREQGWVEDETAAEDRNGERKRWETKAFKWKLERRK